MLDLRLVKQEADETGEYKVYDIRLNSTDEEPIYRVAYTNTSYKSIQVATSYNAHNEQYIPDIYFEQANRWSGTDKDMFKIQTTSYGSMEVEEIGKVIAGLNIAKEVVLQLTEMFL